MILLTRAYYKARGLTPLVYGSMPPVREKRLSLITKMEPLPIVTGNMSGPLADIQLNGQAGGSSGGNLYASGRHDARSGWDEQHGRCDAGDDGFS